MSSTWTRIQHTHLTDRVYEEVRARILSRQIRIDEQLNVDEVAEELGVSRTPVVDAIKRLATEGLVEIKARRGTFVKGITEHDAEEIFQIREALELFAVRHAIEGNCNADVAAKMRELLDYMSKAISATDFTDYSGFTKADRAFHSAMIDACDNERMKATYENLNVHLHIMRSHFFKRLDPPMRVHADHTQILEAVEGRDLKAAELVIKSHLKSIREKMIDNIRANGGVL